MINIIIPCYNSRETLPKTLDSLVAQTQRRFFVTIVDDCSEEDIDDIVEEYSKRLNISYLRLEENGGPGVARQAGIDNNRMCEYLMFLDSDDMLMPQAIEVLNREVNLHKPDILVSGFIQQNKYGIDQNIHSDKNMTWVHGKVYSYKFLVDNNIHFPEGLRINEDGAFNTMAFGISNNVYRTSVITTLWVDNKNSLTRSDKNFSVSCLPDYIDGQVYAYSFLLDKEKINKKSFSCGIVYMYNYIQVLSYKGISLSDEIEKKLTNYLKRIEGLGLFEDREFMKNLTYFLSKDKNTSGYYYFDTYTFKDWLKIHGVILSESNFD